MCDSNHAAGVCLRLFRQVTAGTTQNGFGNRWEIENVQACSPRCAVQEEGGYERTQQSSDGSFTATVHLNGRTLSPLSFIRLYRVEAEHCRAQLRQVRAMVAFPAGQNFRSAPTPESLLTMVPGLISLAAWSGTRRPRRQRRQ